MSEQFDKPYWEERYRGHTALYSTQPNPHLVTAIEDRAPGTALEAGCGAGTDAIWLASRGWRVTAVDIATSALRQARERAEALGTDIASRIEWVPADLTGWTPPPDRFDLVYAFYVHPAAPQTALFARLAASVAPGGTLLIVGHHPSDDHLDGAHGPAPETYVTAGEVATNLDADRWDITVAEASTRSVVSNHGHEMTMHDAVLSARKHPHRRDRGDFHP